MSRSPASTARHFILAVHFLSVFFLMGNSAFAEDKTGSGDKIKELKEKRLDLLVKIHELALQRLKAGAAITFDQLRQTQVDLLAARLDLAETKEVRIKVCEEAVKDAEAWEEAAMKLVQAGDRNVTGIDALKAQAYVLETQIGLEKAKAAK